MNTEDIWEKVLELIKKELHPVSFNTWFDKTKLFKLTDDKVIIQVPMALHKKMLLSNYYDLINDSFATVTGVERDIECLLEDEIEDISMNTTQEGTTEKLIEDVINEDTYKAKFTFDSNLNKDLNFDNFVVGDTNKFAKTAALAVAENPGTTYNPLFIYGKSGIGKTHLMHAIGNYINETKPNLKVLYTTSDDFRKDYTGIANQNGNSLDYANDFKNKYRNIDVLIIDDIQYLVDAKKTQ